MDRGPDISIEDVDRKFSVARDSLVNAVDSYEFRMSLGFGREMKQRGTTVNDHLLSPKFSNDKSFDMVSSSSSKRSRTVKDS